MLSFKAVFENGVARPLSPIPFANGQEVLITFFEEPVDDPLAAEEAAFVALHPLLCQQYMGQYVAIYNQQVADYDLDLERLTERIYTRLGDVPVWIAPVREAVYEEWVVASQS
jgi:hypothetical protein